MAALYVRHPYAEEVARWLDAPQMGSARNLAEEQLPLVTAMVRGYTRGAGFIETEDGPLVAEDLAAVLVSVCARSVSNPKALRTDSWQVDGDYSQNTVHAYPAGFTLLESAVVNRYRRRTA